MKFFSATLLTGLLIVELGTSICLAAPISLNGQSIAPIFLSQKGSAKTVGASNPLMEQLNLSDQQKQDLSGIRQKYQGQMKQLQEQLRTSNRHCAL
jgi:Spy/CpxP family protein refolding chaperone